MPSEFPIHLASDLVPSEEIRALPDGPIDKIEPDGEEDAADSDRLSDHAIDFLCAIDLSPTHRRGDHDSIGKLIGPCGSCGQQLPWSAPLVGQPASPVTCRQCGRWYYTLGRSDASPGLTIPRRSRGGLIFDKLRAFLKPRQSESVRQLFVSLLGPDRYLGAERRLAVRRACSAQVVVVPVDEEGRPIGEAIAQTLLDVSEGGVGMIGNEPVEAELLLIDFTQAGVQGVQALARKAWSRTQDGFTKTGAEFLVPPGAAIPLG